MPPATETRAHPRLTLSVAALLLSAQASPAFGGGCGATFVELDVLGFFNESFAYGVSPDGGVAVGRNSLTGPLCQASCLAWQWSTLGPGGSITPPDTDAQALAASTGGEIIVGVKLFSGGGSFIWSQETGMQPLPMLPGSTFSEALDISADGARIVGVSGHPSGEQAILIEDGVVDSLGTLPGGVASAAYAISLDGTTVVGYSRSGSALSTRRPFRWTSETGMQPLGALPPGATWAEADAVSADGLVIAGSLEGSKGFFRWTSESGMVKLPVHTGSVTGISADGSIVIGNGQLVANGPSGAIIWDAVHGARLLKSALADEWGVGLPGWTFSSVQDISADGLTLVGFGWNPQSARRAWSITIEPPFGDLTGDCEVGPADLLALLRAWETSDAAADLSGDGVVDGEDLGLLLGAWSSGERRP
jgi:uncharacterized membrane protein